MNTFLSKANLISVTSFDILKKFMCIFKLFAPFFTYSVPIFHLLSKGASRLTIHTVRHLL
jgi:hypothetical protein